MMRDKTTTLPPFAGFRRPNYTPVPDELFDELMSALSGAELKVLLYIIRRTFGFKKGSDNISLNQISRGITTRAGRVLDHGTGLSQSTVQLALKGLLARQVITAIRRMSPERGYEPTTYRLNLHYDEPSAENRGREGVEIGEGHHRGSVRQEPALQETAHTLRISKRESQTQPDRAWREQERGAFHQRSKAQGENERNEEYRALSAAPDAPAADAPDAQRSATATTRVMDAPPQEPQESQESDARFAQPVITVAADDSTSARLAATGLQAQRQRAGSATPPRALGALLGAYTLPLSLSAQKRSANAQRSRPAHGRIRPTPPISVAITEISQEFGDLAHLASNATQAMRLLETCARGEAGFVSALYEARSITRQQPRVKKRMPYFWMVVRDLLDVEPPNHAHS